VIGSLLVVVVAINAAILSGMLATLFFAITVVYVLEPLFLWLHHRGLSRWMAGAVSTAAAGIAVLTLAVPLAVTVYLRRDQITELLGRIPDEVVIETADFTYVADTRELIESGTELLAETAIDIAAATPVLAAKAVVFVFVVFAILIRREELAAALLAPIPEEYTDTAVDLHERVRQTLLALYVTQAATALGTFLIAVPVFAAFGYDSPVVLAVAAGLLQFLPVIGPSVVIIALAAFEVTQGGFGTAILLLVVGLALIGFLPDALIRPQLARRTADLPASLYFVGFTGGILSLGAIGIIAGPLAVGLLVETIALLGEVDHRRPSEDA
jgi:predicted PurR-regulated permease PerM